MMELRKVQISNELLLPEVVKLLQQGQQVKLRVKGNSMLPFIVGGRDLAILKREDTYACGDVVLAQLPTGNFVLHRIIGIQGEQITLMGDGNLAGTEQCTLERIAGRVIRIIRNGQEIDCNNKRQRFLAAVWKKLRPVRRYLLAAYRI